MIDMPELLDAIAISDAAVKACPVENGRVAFKDECPLCGAKSDETCFRTAAADYRAMKLVRDYVRRSLAARAKQARPPVTGQPGLIDALASIRIYANDTLSGRADGPADAAWYRAGIVELRNRARAALTDVIDDAGREG